MTERPGPASVRATTASILERFRGLLRQATLWQQPDILGLDVTMSQAKCLFVVCLHPDIAMSALAAQLGVGPSTTSGIVDRLVEHGYLMRREDPSDRRQQLVSLTDSGRDVTERFRRFSADRLAELLVGLSQPELEALLVGLSALQREAGRLQAPVLTSAPAAPPAAHVRERSPA